MKRVAKPDVPLSIFIETEPAPASRPRVTRWNGVYYGKNYEKFRRSARPLVEQMEGVPTDKPVVVMIDTVCTKPKTGKLAYPRGDSDNFAKGPLDVMTDAKKFWDDDNQAVGLCVFKRYAEEGETAGVNVHWFEVEK